MTQILNFPIKTKRVDRELTITLRDTGKGFFISGIDMAGDHDGYELHTSVLSILEFAIKVVKFSMKIKYGD